MDNSDIFIINDDIFRIGDTYVYEINMIKIESFIRDNIKNISKIISFCDQIYYIAKKTPTSQINMFFDMLSNVIATKYFVTTLLKIIMDITEANNKYSYIVLPCELAIIKIGSSDRSACSEDLNFYGNTSNQNNANKLFILNSLIEYQICSDNVLNFYIENLLNSKVFNFLLFLIEFDRAPKSSLNLILNELGKYTNNGVYKTEQHYRQKIKDLFLSIINLSSKNYISYGLLYILRFCPNTDEVKVMLNSIPKCQSNKLKMLSHQIKENIYVVEDKMEELFTESNIVTNIAKIEAYIKIHNNIDNIDNTDSHLIKKYCAHMLADYVNTDNFFLKSEYKHLLKPMRDIVNKHNLTTY